MTVTVIIRITQGDIFSTIQRVRIVAVMGQRSVVIALMVVLVAACVIKAVISDGSLSLKSNMKIIWTTI